MAGPLRGGGVRAGPLSKIELFPKFQRPLSSRGGGGLCLNGPAIKRRTFFAASITFIDTYIGGRKKMVKIPNNLFDCRIFSDSILSLLRQNCTGDTDSGIKSH